MGLDDIILLYCLWAIPSALINALILLLLRPFVLWYFRVNHLLAALDRSRVGRDIID